MKVKMMVVLTGMLVPALILIMAGQLAMAASSEELTIVSPMIGNQIPIPWEEMLTANDWIKLIYDPLVGTNPDGSLSTAAGLAEKWEMSPDGLTWTFYLRKGVKFHDGVELTAKDVKFTTEMNASPKSTLAFVQTFREMIKNTEAKDKYTVVVHLKQPNLFLHENLFSDIGTVSGSIAPKDYFEKVGRDQFVKKPIGTGPYKFHSQLIGSFIKFEATDRHWRDGVPRYKYVTFRIIPEEITRIAMLKTGEADIARISRGSMKECLNAGLGVVSKKGSAIVQGQPNYQYDSPTLSDLRLRKALNLAIDRDAIIKNIFEGMASPTTTYPGMNISGVRGAPVLKPYPYDPKEARRLIKEGKFEGVEVIVPNIPRAGCPEMSQMVEAVCGYWEKVGLKPKIQNIEWPQFRALRRARKTVGQVQFTDATSTKGVSLILMLFRENLHSKGENPFVNDPKVDEMIDRGEKSLDRAEVEQIVSDLYRYMYDNHVFIAICDIDDMIATTKRVPKWDPGQRRNERNFIDLIKQK